MKEDVPLGYCIGGEPPVGVDEEEEMVASDIADNAKCDRSEGFDLFFCRWLEKSSRSN